MTNDEDVGICISQPLIWKSSCVFYFKGTKGKMSQRDGFTGGLLAGIAIGGLVGGVIGAILAGQRNNSDEDTEQSLLKSRLSEKKAMKGKKSQLNSEESIEAARRSLEDKIAQLNTAIDDVRQQLGPVNGSGSTELTDREGSLDS